MFLLTKFSNPKLYHYTIIFYVFYFFVFFLFSDKDTIKQLHLQLHELNEISHNLKLEMEAYDRLVKQFGIDRINQGIH